MTEEQRVLFAQIINSIAGTPIKAMSAKKLLTELYKDAARERVMLEMGVMSPRGLANFYRKLRGVSVEDSKRPGFTLTFMATAGGSAKYYVESSYAGNNPTAEQLTLALDGAVSDAEATKTEKQTRKAVKRRYRVTYLEKAPVGLVMYFGNDRLNPAPVSDMKLLNVTEDGIYGPGWYHWLRSSIDIEMIDIVPLKKLKMLDFRTGIPDKMIYVSDDPREFTAELKELTTLEIDSTHPYGCRTAGTALVKFYKYAWDAGIAPLQKTEEEEDEDSEATNSDQPCSAHSLEETTTVSSTDFELAQSPADV